MYHIFLHFRTKYFIGKDTDFRTHFFRTQMIRTQFFRTQWSLATAQWCLATAQRSLLRAQESNNTRKKSDFTCFGSWCALL